MTLTSAWRHRAFTYGITIPFAIVLAFPFVWMFITSLKPEAQVYDPKKVWSFHPTLASYGYLFHHTDYVRWLENSCFVGLLVVLITLVLPGLTLGLTGAEPFTVAGPEALAVVIGYPTMVPVRL